VSAFSDAINRQLVRGDEFVLDAPDHVPAAWGRGREVLWSEGESLFIAGPQGVGKTTLMQQLALRRAGVLDDDLLGFPVTTDTDRLTLYLALDRPRQIARSFKRMVTGAPKLERLIVWEGPLPFNLVKHPETLSEFVREVGEPQKTPVGNVFIDSVKDIASPLSSDEVGAAVNRALGGLIARRIEVVASHHQRKATAENRRPTRLSDVYGSTWITAGSGSVILLWGEPGDPIVELTHLKQPVDEVGPLELSHDHDHGVTTRRDRPDAWTVLQAATGGGVTARDAADNIHGGKPSKSQIEKVRRRLERFVTEEKAVRIEASEKFAEVLYRPVVKDSRVTTRDESVTTTRDEHGSSTDPSRDRHVPVTHTENAPPYVVGGGKRGEKRVPVSAIHGPIDDDGRRG
jgi:hypothetical protein